MSCEKQALPVQKGINTAVDKSTGDGIALTSMQHPTGLIDHIVEGLAASGALGKVFSTFKMDGAEAPPSGGPVPGGGEMLYPDGEAVEHDDGFGGTGAPPPDEEKHPAISENVD